MGIIKNMPKNLKIILCAVFFLISIIFAGLFVFPKGHSLQAFMFGMVFFIFGLVLAQQLKKRPE